MREMKDSGIEWIGNVPKIWSLKPIRALFDEVTEKNFLGTCSNALKFTYGSIVRKHNFDADAEDYVASTILNYTVVEPGTIMLNGLNLNFDFVSQRIGLVKEKGVITSAYMAFKPNEKQLIDSEFATYLFKAYDGCKAFHNMGGGVRKILNFNEFKKYYIPLPDLNEQQHIVDLLDTQCSEIDATAEDIQKEISLLEDYKKSVVTEAVTIGLNPDAEMKDSGIEYIGITPIHWNKYRLKYILLERNIRTTTGEEMLLSVSQYKGVVPSKDINNRTMQANSLIGYKIVKKDDLVFNKLNPGLARFGNSEFDGITSPDFSVYIVDDKKCTAKFLQHLLKTYKYVAKIKGDCTGVGDGFARLYSEQLYRFVVSLPPIEELHSIVAYIDSKSSEIDSLIVDKKRQLDILADYKKSLIYEYVTGKKEVPVNE